MQRPHCMKSQWLTWIVNGVKPASASGRCRSSQSEVSRKMLQTYADSGQADPQIDLSQLRTMQQLQAEINDHPLPQNSLLWKGPQTDLNCLQTLFQQGETLRKILREISPEVGSGQQIAGHLKAKLSQAERRNQLHLVAKQFSRAAMKYSSMVQKFRELAGGIRLTRMRHRSSTHRSNCARLYILTRRNYGLGLHGARRGS